VQRQDYANHAHRPIPTAIGLVLLLYALGTFWRGWSALGPSLATGLLALGLAVAVLLYISRAYTTKLQDRIIRLEMRVRGASTLTSDQQRLLAEAPIKQVVALRFASDAELPDLLERAARDKMTPADIKRAIRAWNADYDRT